MRRMITDKQVETLDNVVYNPQTNTTEVGGHLYVDGETIVDSDLKVNGEIISDCDLKVNGEVIVEYDLKVNGNIISGMPIDISVFGESGITTTYTKEQLIDICLKYRHNGFSFGSGDIGNLVFLDPNAQYVEGDPDSSRIFVIQSLTWPHYDFESNWFYMGGDLFYAWALIGFYSGENEITLQSVEY